MFFIPVGSLQLLQE